MLLFSCASHPPLADETVNGVATSAPPDYEIVFIIHGDGNYLFHDSEGNSFRADEQTLAGAIKVAEQNSRAEVFIFHEKHRRHTLFLFPRRDGEFFYYRNGRAIAHELYWRDQGQSRFSPEVALYNRFRGKKEAQPMSMFLYFGHEIPEFGGKGYDASYRERPFIIQDLADGLKEMAPASAKFDLVVLSTCFNGTPHTVSKLSPFARYIIASPGNLHLSYFNLQPFEKLDVSLNDRDISAFARECARQSFDRLTKDIQTEITVVLYDVDRVQPFVRSVGNIYDQALTSLAIAKTKSVQHCDCAEDSAYMLPAMSDGVEVLYRPARFGRSSHKQQHSGWECPKFP